MNLTAGEGLFCKACQAFKITPEQFTVPPSKTTRVQQLGKYGDIRGRTSCSLCKLLTRAYANGPIPHGPRREGGWTMDDLRVQGCWAAIGEGLNESYLVFHLFQYAGDATRLQVRPLLTSENAPAHRYQAILVSEPQVHIDMVKSWLTACETDATCSARANSKWIRRPASFKLINVIDGNLVDQEEECRYLTLSYVWGSGEKFMTKKQNLDMLSEPGGLNKIWDQLSATIQDAVVLTQSIGEKFLWVDSLCIVQDAEDTKPAILEDMVLIYKQALLMICAADDSCASIGLQGINGKSRLAEQYVENIGPDLDLVASFDFTTYVESAVYNSRGWTYQEEQNAERSLVFVNNQVYFRCPSRVCSEDVMGSLSKEIDQALFFPCRARALASKDRSAVSRYFSSVETFTIRNLTFPSDILNAFIGTLSQQCASLAAKPHFGLPTSIFDLALLWQPIAQTSRRPGFPSWSWAGWYGGVKWYGDTYELASYGADPSMKMVHEKVTKWLRKHTWIDWYSLDTNDELVPLWYLDPELGKAHDLENSETKDLVGYDSPSLNNHFGRSREPNEDNIVNTTRKETLFQETILSNYSQQYLHLFTVSTYYRLQIPEHFTYLRYGSIDPVWISNGRLLFHILNRHLQVCGYVLLDESWRARHLAESDQLYEFILLSDANYHSEWQRPHEQHPYKKFWPGDYENQYKEFHAMMIIRSDDLESERGQEQKTVYERAGLARLHGEAIKDAWAEGAVWKEITLG